MVRARVEVLEQIRRDRREGFSIRELADRHGVHRRTVRQALVSAMPPPRKPYVARSKPSLDPWIEVIDGWLSADREVPRKQRHGAGLDRSRCPRTAPAHRPSRSDPAGRDRREGTATHLGYLAEVLAAEVDDRSDRRRTRRINDAKFPRVKRLADFNVDAVPSIQPATLATLAKAGTWTPVNRSCCSAIPAPGNRIC